MKRFESPSKRRSRKRHKVASSEIKISSTSKSSQRIDCDMHPVPFSSNIEDFAFPTRNETFSPGGPLDWPGSAWWCGRDWAGGGGGARGDRSGIVCSDQKNRYQGSPRGCLILPLWMFPSPSPTPSACGWRPIAGRTGARPWPRVATCRAPGGAGAAVDGGGHGPDHPGPRHEGEPGHRLQVSA